MMNFVETRDMTATKIKNEARITLMSEIADFLREKYGDANVGMVRVGTATSKKNTLAVRVGQVEVGGEVKDLCDTIDISTKDYSDRVTTSKTFTAFDFDAARTAYDTYLAAKAEAKKKKADENTSSEN